MRALPGTNLQQKLKAADPQSGHQPDRFFRINMPLSKSISANRATFLTCSPICKDRCGRREKLGGRPFLTDCNTLYVGAPQNALDHIKEAAYKTGFPPFSTGCQIIVLRRRPEKKGRMRWTCRCAAANTSRRSPYPGRAVMDADIFISLSTSKGTSTGLRQRHQNISAWAAVRAARKDGHALRG